MLSYLCSPHWGPVNFLFDFNIDLLKVSVIKTNCSSKLVFFVGLQVPIKLPCLGTNGALQEVSRGNRKSPGTHTLQFNIFLISLFLLGYLSPPFQWETKWIHHPGEILFLELPHSPCSLCLSLLLLTSLFCPSFSSDLGEVMMTCSTDVALKCHASQPCPTYPMPVLPSH